MSDWHFVAVSNAEMKNRIREAAEVEGKQLYSHLAGDERLKALEPQLAEATVGLAAAIVASCD